MDKNIFNKGKDIEAKIAKLKEHLKRVKNIYETGGRFEICTPMPDDKCEDLADTELGIPKLDQDMLDMYVSRINGRIAELENDFKRL